MKSRYRRRKNAATVNHMRGCPECFFQAVLWLKHERLSSIRRAYGKKGRRW